MILLWLAWGVFVIWWGRIIGQAWLRYNEKEPYAMDPPEFSTFIYLESVLVSNGILRMVLDQKTLYVVQTHGFMGLGFTESQLLFIVAWLVLTGASIRWYLLATRGNKRARWNMGCWLAILGLLATSLFCWLILDIPLSRNAPYIGRV